MTAKNWTPEPWQHVLGHDTHKVKRDSAGRMLGPVTMDLDDYDRACECVNALAGINPEAVREMYEALEAVIHATADSGVWVQKVADALAKARREA